jgi:hypothetical protein
MRASVEENGTYLYLLNGEPTGIQEHWQRRQLAPGEWRISSTRRAPGVEIAVVAKLVDGLVTGFSVEWRGEGTRMQADYALLADRVRVERCHSGAATESMDIPFPDETLAPLLSPLMRIFAGPLIARLLDKGEPANVVVPFIADVALSEKLLSPVVSERSARLIEANATLASGEETIPCRRCEYLGDQYGPGTEFWLGDDELLLRYRWRQAPQQHWDVWLRRNEE